MAIEFKKNKYAGHFPEIWRGECKILPGGFKPKQEFAVGTVLHRGTPLYIDFETMTAAVVKTAKVVKGGTTIAPRLAKGHYFNIGDVVTKNGNGASTPSIMKIDTTNSEYDTVTLSASYTGLVENDILVESKAVEEGTAEPLYQPNAIVGAVKEFNGKGLPAIDAAYEAVVLYPSLAAPVLPEWLNGFCMKLNPNIMFIKQ